MKNNFSSSKKPKIGFVALLLFFCVLWGNGAMGQNVNFFWGGGVSNSWGTAGNWTRTGRYIHTANFASGDTTVTIVTPNLQGAAPSTVLAVGDAIVGPGIPLGTTVTAFSATPGAGTTITLSQPTTAAGSASIIQTYLKSTTTPYNGTSPNTATVVIDNAVLTSPLVSTTNAVANIVLLRNNFGPITGPTLTIDTGGVLTVTNVSVTPFSTAGGNIVNNGTLNITSTSTGASTGIAFIIPTVLPPASPAPATEYSYSGTGALNINIAASTTANSAGINLNSLNANTRYKVLFDGTATFNLSNVLNIPAYAIRSAGGTLTSSLIIGGAGFTRGAVGSEVNGGLIGIGAQSNVTVNAETTLTLHSAATNLTNAILIGSSSTTATNFINKGKINILGSTSRSGLTFNTFLATAAAVPVNFLNEGTLDINLNCPVVGTAPLSSTNGGSTTTTTLAFNLNNTGTLNLTNSSTSAGTGAAIYGVSNSQSPIVAITNNGTLNLLGSSYSFGNSKFSIINNGIINTNNELRGFFLPSPANNTNNVGGTISFVRTAATATTKQVNFNGLTFASAAGLGSTYSDGTNSYVVVNQKFTSATAGTTLTANVLSTATVGTGLGTLSLTSGAGDATIAYSSVSINPTNSALTSTIDNSGIINTDTASNLGIISGVTTTSTSIIAPGGSAGKGIAEFTGATKTILGKLIVQVAGNTSAGVDYDQIINQTVDGGFDITNATLDVTGISGTATPVDIVVANGIGTITGTFASVIGLTPGWSVDYNTAGKVQLIYLATSPNAITWTGGTSTAWTDATNWSTAAVPDVNSDVTIVTGTFEPTISTNVNINSLTITSGTLTIATGINLTISGAIANSGTMTLASNANLIQGGTTNSNTGNVTVNRNSNLLSRLDYTIWSSPVTNASLFLTTFSTATDLNRFYNYNETTNAYNEITTPATTPFAVGTGYLIRMPNDHPTSPTVWSGSFSGVPNNGTINKTINYNGATFGYNMVGNPYPSTIDAQAFITANTANIESSLYFWRKINAATGSAYAVYNPMGSTTATPSSALPNGTIQVGQGFFVKAKSASSVNFTNAMRVANNANQFFKTKAAQKDRVWLNLTNNTSGVFSQALIGYTADATTGVDMYDAKYINDSPIALTSSINSDEYTIQGRPAFDATDVVMLNFKTNADGDYTIAIDQADGVFAAGQDVYLVDSKTGTETNLKTGSYTFAATAGVDNSRFSLKYQKTLSIDTQSFDDNSISVYADNGTLYVNSKSAAINNVTVFDVQGRIIAQKVNVKSTTAVINNLRASNQVLIVKIEGEGNSVVTKKLLN